MTLLYHILREKSTAKMAGACVCPTPNPLPGGEGAIGRGLRPLHPLYIAFLQGLPADLCAAGALGESCQRGLPARLFD